MASLSQQIFGSASRSWKPIREDALMPEPFFSVCIPQYGRTDFLLEAIATLSRQQFRDFEVCISDDKSPDGRQEEIVAALESTGLSYRFEVQKENRRYDANLRTAIGLAGGRYCFLLGNDDALVNEHALGRFHDLIEEYGPCGVVISNFQDYRTGSKVDRVHSTGNRGFGPDVAARHFRNFSFVSGIVLERRPAQAIATERWDGSEMYQTFIGCSLIAGGRSLLEIAEPLISKDISLPNLTVDSYATRPRVRPCPIVERVLPLAKLGRLTVDALRPYVSSNEQKRHNARIFRQLLIFTYPFWLFEYRHVQSWAYAAGIALGMRPQRSALDVEMTKGDRLIIQLCYFASTVVGLLAPRWLFNCARPLLYRLAKRT
jgi:glycosyltransferase involved in cell wall biosynthesis